MCNINLLFRKDISKHKELIIPFLTCVSAVSYNSNPDGDGLSVDGEVVGKSLNKLNFYPYREIIERGKTILSHQRWATSGLTETYTQPFDKAEFILLHNGVISDLVLRENNHSDTYNLFILFNKVYKKISKKEKDRDKAVIKTIKKVFNNVGGTWSIALYDKLTRKTYYFKNDGTYIYAWINKKKDMLFFSTKEENEKFLKIFDEKFNEVKIKDYKIYCISETDKTRIVGTIKENSYWSNSDDDDDEEDKKKDFDSPIEVGKNVDIINIKGLTKEEQDIIYSNGLSKKQLKRMRRKHKPLEEFIEMKKLRLCHYCQIPTNLIGRDYDFKPICSYCIGDVEFSEEYNKEQDKEERLKVKEEREMEEWNRDFPKNYQSNFNY